MVEMAKGDDSMLEMAKFAHHQQQKRAVTLLLVGSISGFMGFLVSTIVGMHDYFINPLGTNYLGQPFPSGHNYKPQTVSEMVHDNSKPEGKAFFAFCLIGAVCILQSWYPWALRNVYEGDDPVVCITCGPAWANFRQFLPPMGMLLVACIPVTPPVNRSFGDKAVITCHTLGAVLMIGGYCLSEIHCLIWGGKADGFMVFKKGEKFWRAILITIALSCGVTFQVCGVLANKAVTWPCADVWLVPTEVDLLFVLKNNTLMEEALEISEAIHKNQMLLYNTAYGMCVWVKAGEFWFEVLAGVFMIFSLLCVWYYCPERHLDFEEKLPGLSKAELREQGYDEKYWRQGHGP